jgi:orotidine-5'-phosphate decarboxylase
MTHPSYLASDNGYLADDFPDNVYQLAKKLGVTDFVVPGNKPDRIAHYRELLGDDAVFYSPGLISQGGDLAEGAKAAGKSWHAIVGRALYDADDPAKVAEELASSL